MFLEGIESLRSVDWSKTYLWDMHFIGGNGWGSPAYPFDSWFPATEVDELVGSIITHDFAPPLRPFSIPGSSNLKRLKISFIDDVYCTLEKYFEEWMDVQILNNGLGVSPVEDCLRDVIIYRLGSNHKPVHGYIYSIFPAGELPFNGRSTSNLNEYSLDFVVWRFKKIL